MTHWPMLDSAEAGTPQVSSYGQGLLHARKIGIPTILPRPHVLGLVGRVGEVRVGTYVWESPVYNAGMGRGFKGQVSLGPPTGQMIATSPRIVGG